MGYKAGNLEGTRKPFHVGTGADEASAQLQVDSTTRGFLPPRMTTAQRVAIATPAEGLMVFDTDFDAYYVFQAASWKQLDMHEQLSGLIGGAANDHAHLLLAQATTLGGLTTVAQGDIAYASAANTWGLLNKSTTANQFMKNSGSSNNPAWAAVNTTDLATAVTGILKGNGTGVVVATAGTDYVGIASANTFTGVNKFENAAGIEVGKDDASNTAGVLKLWGAGANNFYTTFTAGTQSANATYVLPTAMPAGTGDRKSVV